MALTISKKNLSQSDALGLRVGAYEIDFDSSYPTGGEAWDLSADFSRITAAVFESEDAYFYRLTQAGKDDPSAAKVLVYQGDNTNAAAAPGIEVPNTTDLSGRTRIGVIIVGSK